MELRVYKIDGSETAKTVTLDDRIFNVEPNDHAIWLDVKNILANRRQGTHNTLDRATLLSVFDGVPQFTVSRSLLDSGISVIDLCAAETSMFASKGEIRRELKQNSISLNKQKIGEDYKVTSNDILQSGLLLFQKGKKNYYIVKIED